VAVDGHQAVAPAALYVERVAAHVAVLHAAVDDLHEAAHGSGCVQLLWL